MKKISSIALSFGLIFTGCGQNSNRSAASSQGTVSGVYQNITPQQAKQLMDAGGVTILDVRTQSEYDEGHIKGALLIPDSEIAAHAEQILTDKNATILVYCRSGRRSALAAQALADMGYTDVRDFGGIIDWPYTTVR